MNIFSYLSRVSEQDRFKDEDPEGHTMKSVIKPICKLGVDVMFCRVKKSRTAKTEQLMQQVYIAENRALKVEDRSMTTINLFDEVKEEVVRFHFIFCLDESGSMGGRPWDALLRAYQTFINKRRNDQGMGDLVSTITFSSGCRNQGMLVPIGSVNVNLQYNGGGTNFDQALAGAQEALARNPPDCIPFLLFMSDGHGGGNPIPTIQTFRARYKGFKCDTIGLGGVDVATMTRMAEAGGGSYHASDISNISNVFGEIAAGCAALDGMVQKFGEEIAKMVSTRIVLEHL